MEIIELTCIGCPLGCQIKVEKEDEKVGLITGNTCRRGEDYAKKEVTNPTRIVTSTIQVINGLETWVPVKTQSDVAKDKMMEVIKELKTCVVTAPVELGQIVFKNVTGTGINIVATKSVRSSK